MAILGMAREKELTVGPDEKLLYSMIQNYFMLKYKNLKRNLRKTLMKFYMVVSLPSANNGMDSLP